MNGRQFLALLVICAVAAYAGALGGVRMLAPASAQVAPLGNGGPAVGCADATLTCTGGYNVQVNLANANAWTGIQSFNGAGACSGAGVPTTLFGVCYGAGNGTTNVIAAAYGPQSASGWGCTTTCTASNSSEACFYGETTTGPTGQCIYTDSGGFLNAFKLKIDTQLDMGLSTISRPARIGGPAACSGTGAFTGPANDGMDCLVTLSSGAATWTFGSGGVWTAAPICTATDTTAANAVKVSATTTAVTLAGTTSDVIAVVCMGNGNV